MCLSSYLCIKMLLYEHWHPVGGSETLMKPKTEEKYFEKKHHALVSDLQWSWLQTQKQPHSPVDLPTSMFDLDCVSGSAHRVVLEESCVPVLQATD